MSIFKKLKWGIEYLAYRGVEKIANSFSPAQVFGAGRYLGLLMYHASRKRRAIVVRNLRVAYGDTLSIGELKSLAHLVFTRSGSNLLSSFRSTNFTMEELQERMDFQGLAEFQRHLDNKTGLILLIPHMGNWELLSQTIRFVKPGPTLGTHYRKLNNPYLNTHIEAQRNAHGTRLFSKDDSPHAIVSLLREGGAIGILADQRAGTAGHWATYYGNFTTCSPLPEILSKRTKAAVALMCIQTTSPARWKVTLETLDDTTTPSCMKAIERGTRRSPADVFWFQDRWEVERTNPFGINGKVHPKVDLDEEEKPLRLLIWLPSADSPLPALPEKPRTKLQLDVAFPEGSTPPSYPDYPWSALWPLDPEMQPEHYERELTRIDEGAAMPLCGVITTDPHPDISSVCKPIALKHILIPPGSRSGSVKEITQETP